MATSDGNLTLPMQPAKEQAGNEVEIHDEVELTVLMPCLNEAETLATCIAKAKSYFQRAGIRGEVLIADNGSTDGSQDIARGLGARVLDVPVKGYGAALGGGIADARGRYVIMGDSDDSYDFSNLDLFVEELRAGADLVMGNRFRGGIKPGAMPPLHRYLGNPVLSFIGRIFFNSPVRDFHCGLRGFRRQSILALDLRTSGMEFASEMVVKATLHGLRITEVPTVLSPDGRSRQPHLRSWRDGWRHLRFLLIYSPSWLFLYPGLGVLLLGCLGLAALLTGPVVINGTTFDVHTMLISSLMILLGVQLVSFAVLAREYAVAHRLLPLRPPSWIEALSLETWLITGGLLCVSGLVAIAIATLIWEHTGFGPLTEQPTMRFVIPGVTATVIGVHLMFAGFFRSVLKLRVD